jgi:purine-binding chemotaxis protein CheW
MTQREEIMDDKQPRQLCTFYLGGHFYGIDVVRVQEVIRYQEMTRVPLAPRDIRGLINLRGQIVTAVDMRRRLGLPERTGDALPMNVVIRSDEGAASLLVDEIGDVMEVTSASYDAVPQTVPQEARSLLRGVFKLENRLLLELDTDRIVSSTASAA